MQVVLTGGFGRQMLQFCGLVQTLQTRKWETRFTPMLIPFSVNDTEVGCGGVCCKLDSRKHTTHTEMVLL